MTLDTEDTSMNFLDHLKELRQKLIYSIIFFLIAFVVSFYFSQSNLGKESKTLKIPSDHRLQTFE